MPAKIVLSLLTLALVGGGAALVLTGNAALVVVGVLLVLLGALLGGTAFSLLRDPEAAAERLTARRSQLEARTGHPGAPETAAAAPVAVADEPTSEPLPQVEVVASGNRAQRRAADRAGKGRGRPSRTTRR